MPEERVGKNGIRVDKNGEMANLRAGAYLRVKRQEARLTQEELAERMFRAFPGTWASPETARSYVVSMENGRMAAPTPQKINPFHEVLGYPGWELLDLLGYDTDGDADSRIVPELRAVIIKLDPEQQRLLAKFGKNLLN